MKTETVRIWVDAEYGCDTHIYISINGGNALHYYHWDSLLLWHDTDIINAERVEVS